MGRVTPDFVAYPEVRRGVRGLLDGRPGTHRRPVPACPEWTVTDLLGHLALIAERVLERHGGVAPAPAGPLGVPALLDRWDDVGAQLDRLLADAGGRSGEVMVMDAYTHELDLRAALGVAPPVRALRGRAELRGAGPRPVRLDHRARAPGAAAAVGGRRGVDGGRRASGRDGDRAGP